MYLKFYNLRAKPFEMSPDPKFLWLGEKHKGALVAMTYGILENKGFISLTGDVGTGKTTLVNTLANSLGNNIIFAQIPDPSLNKLDFFNFTAAAFEMNKKFNTKGDFLGHLERFLNHAYCNNKEVVLIIEEAQRMERQLLEEVRLLSNIEKPNKKLINFLFVGQNEFINILEENKALKQRITISYHVEPLSDIETEKYIIHRLKVAGSERRIFIPSTIREIFSFSAGNPRLINVICDLALLSGYLKKTKIIKPKIIRECANNVVPIPHAYKDTIEDQKALIKTIQKTSIAIQPGTLEQLYQKLVNRFRKTTARRTVAYLAPSLLIILTCISGYIYYLLGYKTSSMNPETVGRQSRGHYTSSKSETSFQKPNEITTSQDGIDKPQIQLLDLKAQKASADIQLNQLKSRNAKLEADLKELKSTKARVAELESALTTREQMLSQFKQKLTELEKDLEQEKKSKDMLGADLSSKVILVTEFQRQLETYRSNTIQMEDEIEKSKTEIAELQSRLSASEQKIVAAQSSPKKDEVPEKQTSTSEIFDKEAESPNPADIIDWVLKKKSK